MTKLPKISNEFEYQAINTYLRTGRWLAGLSKSSKDTIRKKANKFTIIEDQICINDEGIFKKYIPPFDPEAKERILQGLHYQDHIGGRNLYSRVSEQFVGIERSECIDFVARCETCQRLVQIPEINTTLRPIYSSYSGQRLLVDAIDLRRYGAQNDGYKWIFTFIDSFSKFGWGFAAIDKRGDKFAKILRQFFLREGEWDIFHTDNGREFQNQYVEAVLAEMNIPHISGRPYHPQSQGQIERFNRTIKKRLKAVTTRNNRWIDHLDDIISNYNNCTHSATGIKPFVLFRSSDRSARRYLHGMRERNDINQIRQRVKDYIDKWKTEYERRVNQSSLQIGDRVLVAIRYRRALNQTIHGLFDNLYENGIWEIIENEENHFIISNIENREIKRVRKCLVKKINQ